MKLRPLLFGLATFFPGVNKLFFKGTGGTNSGRYCYTVWLRHLVKAESNDLDTYPRFIAELGPGDSIGLGLAALLCGAETYHAFDVVKYANLDKNLAIFEELIDLFKRRENIPDDKEFPHVMPYLDSYQFPHHLLTDKRLQDGLNPLRLEEIRNSIRNININPSRVRYVVPWDHYELIQENSVDMIYSQAVLEHVDHLRPTYKALYRWLRPGGFMSHLIDFKSHGITTKWNDHWTYSDCLWSLIRGRRSYLINREPHSAHIQIMKELQFKIISDVQFKAPSLLDRKQLSKRFQDLSDEDLTTTAAFIQSVKTW